MLEGVKLSLLVNFKEKRWDYRDLLFYECVFLNLENKQQNEETLFVFMKAWF